MFSQEERGRAVELYLSTSMTTQQVVEHLGYPTRQCLERWLHQDPRYMERIPKPIIPLSMRVRAVRLCLTGLQQQAAAARLGVSAGVVNHWMALYRPGWYGSMATPKEVPDARRRETRGSPCF